MASTTFVNGVTLTDASWFNDVNSITYNTTGSGNTVLATSPTLVTPVLGAATATSINKVAITAPATSATITVADGKTLTASNSITLAGTDSTTMTFPSTNATIARTDSAQTFTGVQSMTSPAITTSITTPSTTFALVNTTATTVNAFGAATTLNIGNVAGTNIITGYKTAIYGDGTDVNSFRVQRSSANVARIDLNYYKIQKYNGSDVVDLLEINTSGGGVTLGNSGTANTIAGATTFSQGMNGTLGSGTPAALAATTGAFSGAVTVTRSANDSATYLSAINTSAGTAASASFQATSSAASLTGYMIGGGFTTAGRYIQASGLIETAGAGGLNFSSSHASGSYGWYINGDNKYMSLTSTGLAVTGVFTSSGTAALNGATIGNAAARVKVTSTTGTGRGFGIESDNNTTLLFDLYSDQDAGVRWPHLKMTSSTGTTRVDLDTDNQAYAFTGALSVTKTLTAATGADTAKALYVEGYPSGIETALFYRDNTDNLPVIKVRHDRATGATSASMILFADQSNTTVGSISSTGTATAYNTSSDRRLKNITGDLTNSGEFIDALRPRVGTWKADGSPFVGFVADEVQAVSPRSVVGEPDEVDADGNPVYQAMEYGSAEFIANIIAELKSLRSRVAILEAR